MTQPMPAAVRTADAGDTQPPSPIDAVADWLIEQALGDSELEELFNGCCDRLLEAGLPLWRAHISFSVLHPLYSSMGITWHRGQELDLEIYPYRPRQFLPERFRATPFFHMMRARLPSMRRRLVGDDAALDFPILSQFRDAGATDYLAFKISFGTADFDGMVGSWTTDRPGGFSDADALSLQGIQRRLGVACKVRVRERIARNVVDTYLGSLAGRRVLDGRIKHGDGETIRAVIWYCDMRGSTHLADTLPRADYIQALNDYFACTGGAVLAHGGEILSFIGDAVLAMFPIDRSDAPGGAAAACEYALAACRSAQERLAEANARRAAKGRPTVSYGLALHLGDVLFGNVGVAQRMAFSVIGPTVNEVARLASLTKELGRPLLASDAFASHAPVAWEPLGEFELRGVGQPISVLAPLT